MVDPQVVYLVSDTHHMTVAVCGAQTRVTRDFDNFEIIQEHDSPATAAREFARWIGRASQEGWDLDPEMSPNPAPLDGVDGFEPTPEEVRLWREVSRTVEDELVVDLRRLRGRKDAVEVASPFEHPAWQGVCEELCKANPPKLRIKGESRYLLDPLPVAALDKVEELTLGGRTRISSDDHGDLAWVLQAMPSLEKLAVSGVFDFEEASHATLRSLSLAGDPVSAESLLGVSRSSLPALESMTLRIAHEEDVEDELFEAVTALLESDVGKSIKELTIRGGAFLDELFAVTVKHCPPNLERLEVPDELADVEGVIELLKAHEKALAKVSLLLDTDSWEDEELAYLNAAFTVIEPVEEDEEAQ